MRPPMKPLKPLDEALADLLAKATPLPGTETVTTFDADGRVLAQNCVSALQVPPQDNSSMDGYAVRCARAAQGVDGGVAPVGHDAKVRHLAAQAQQHGAQEKAVAVVNGTRAHLLRRHLAGHDQFIARGEQRHAGATGHLQFVQADAGGQAQLGRGQACAGRQHHGTPGDVLARAADPLALWGHGVDAHLAQSR